MSQINAKTVPGTVFYTFMEDFMKEKRTQPQKKSGFKMSLGMKRALLTIIIALVAKMGIAADEHFNKKIVETFNEMIGDDEFHFAGIDQDGDGFADLFISVPYINQSPFLRRLAGFLRESATVSFDDKTKSLSRSMGIYLIEPDALLEINGRSVLQIFPNEKPGNFPAEVVRQARLKSER